jgi:hypothetical protein
MGILFYLIIYFDFCNSDKLESIFKIVYSQLCLNVSDAVIIFIVMPGINLNPNNIDGK